MSRLVAASIVSEGLRECMRVSYDHHTNILDFPGGFLFMMALDICKSSVPFDIEGAQEKLEELTLDINPGEDISAFTANAQKQVKVMQSGYALPIRVGSKMLMKVVKLECEYFNWNIFSILDDVKEMEDNCLGRLRLLPLIPLRFPFPLCALDGLDQQCIVPTKNCDTSYTTQRDGLAQQCIVT
jgi:hypothetical protein